MDNKRTALFYIVLILRTSTSTPLERTTSSIAPSIITLSSYPTDSSTSNYSIWNSFTIWGTVVGSVIVTTILLCAPFGICSLGFCSIMSLIILGAGSGAALGFGIGFGLKKLSSIFNSQIDVSNNFTAVHNDGNLNQTLQFSSNGDETAELLNVSSDTPVENNMTWSNLFFSSNSTSNHSIWSQYTLWGAVAGALILTPLFLRIQTCLGFAGAGIRMGSIAAKMMSCSAKRGGGGIVAGSCIAICQSIGALGVCSLGFVPIGIIIIISSAIGFGVGYGVQRLTQYINELINGSSEDCESATLYNNINGTERGESKFDPEAIELQEETSQSKQSSLIGNSTSEPKLSRSTNQTEIEEGSKNWNSTIVAIAFN